MSTYSCKSHAHTTHSHAHTHARARARALTHTHRAATQSLSGHTSAVECVSFDSKEQAVIAGSAGGTLKLWDLEKGSVARTLTGHRSNCISVQVSRRPPRTAPLTL